MSSQNIELWNATWGAHLDLVMLEATHTLFFIIGFLILFSVIIPFVSRFVKISFTWTLVIIYLGILFGIIFDFSHLTNEVRMILAIGSILVSVAYILSHVSEKARARGEQMRLPEMHVKRGNTLVDVKFADAKKLTTDEDLDVDLNELSTIPHSEQDPNNQAELHLQAQQDMNIPMSAQQAASVMQNQALRNTHERVTAQENPYARQAPPVQAPTACAQSNRTLRPISSVNNILDQEDLGQLGQLGNAERRVRRENTGVHRMSSSQGFVSTRSGNWNQPH